MIAWWIWLGRQIAGDTALGVRLAPAFAGALTALLTSTWRASRASGDRTAARAGVWLSATVLMGLAGQMAVPDAPGTLFWTAALCCASAPVRGHGAWWLAAGSRGGPRLLVEILGAVPGARRADLAALTPQGRRQLRSPWPWLAAVVALAVFAPNIAWNASHGWMTFTKQFGRARRRAARAWAIWPS